MTEDLNNNLFDPISASDKMDKASKIVDSLGDVLVDKKSDKARFGNDTLSKKIDSLTDFSGTPKQNVTDSTTVKYNGSNGVYNTMQNGLGEGSKESAYNTATNPIKESDAYQGYSNVKQGLELAGVKPAGYRSASGVLSSAIMSNKVNAMGIVENGKTYGIGTHIYGNSLDNYRRNVQDIDRYLSDHGINSKHLNKSEIKKALKGGYLGDKKLTQQEKDVLKQKLYFDKYQNIAQKAQANKFMTTKARVKEAVKDSDAYKGYKTTEVMVKGVKTGIKLTKVTAGAGIGAIGTAATAPVRLVSQGGKITSKAIGQMASKVQAKTGSKMAKKVADRSLKVNAGFSKVNIVAKKTQKVSSIGGGYVRNFSLKNTLKKGTKAGATAVWNAIPDKGVKKIINKTKNKIVNSKLNDLRKKAQEKWKNSLAKKISKKIAKVIDLVDAIKRKIVLLLGAILLGILALVFLITAIASLFTSNSTTDNPLDIAGCMQTAIDAMYEEQLAYEQNEWNYVEGSEYSEKGVPQAWDLEENEDTIGFLSTNSVVQRGADERNYRINEEGIKFESIFGELQGYNLAHYWGKETFEYFAEVPIYEEIAIDNGDGTYSYEAQPTGNTQIVSVIGEAGISGYINNGMDMDISLLNSYIIPDSDSSYLNRADKYNDVELGYEYLGSEKVEFTNFYNEYPEMYHESDIYSFGYTSDTTGEYSSASIDAMLEVQAQAEGEAEANQFEYGRDVYYKAICSLTAAVAQNASDLNEVSPKSATNFFGNYSKNAFNTIVETSNATLEVEYDIVPDETLNVNTVQHLAHTDVNICVSFPTVKPQFNLKTTYYNAGLADMANLDTGDEIIDDFIQKVKPMFTTYEFPGWWDASNGSMTDNYLYAVEVYGFTDDDFDAFYEGVVFPSDFAKVLSQAEIDDIINNLKLDWGAMTEEQEAIIRYALSLVGTTHYGYGGKNGGAGGLDCSGFISKVMADVGAKNFHGGSCAAILNTNPHSNFDHSLSSLRPGDLLIKNSEWGGEKSSENHIVMYLGNGQFIESTRYNGVSGPQVNSTTNQPGRISKILTYDYVIRYEDIL